MLAEVLLAQALLFRPFRVQSPEAGILIEHNGACCTAATVDAAYADAARAWRERAPGLLFVLEASSLVEIVYYDMQLLDSFCTRTVLSAVVDRKPYGVVIVVNAGRVTREELPEVLHSGFWRAFLFLSGRTDVIARVDRGCLE